MLLTSTVDRAIEQDLKRFSIVPGVAFGVPVDLATDPKPFQISSTLLDFFVVSGIRLSVGGLIGICVAVLTQRSSLAWVEQALMLVTTYGAYWFAEELGGLGVIAVVTTGSVIGFSVQPGVEVVKRSTFFSSHYPSANDDDRSIRRRANARKK
jgi:NhaP-type Na+/H+ or K+/H+ antiporter